MNDHLEMGGTKKKPLAQAEKAQAGQERKSSKEVRRIEQQSRSKALVVPKLDDKEVAKIFGGMKAITLYRAARALDVNASVASSLLRSLESKKVIERREGFSGHYVWKLAG